MRLGRGCQVPARVVLRGGSKVSFEGLVFAEVGNAQAERIDGNEFVRNAALEYENEVRSVQIALELAVVRGRVIDHVKIHPCAVGRVLHFFERHLLHVDVDFRDRSVG